MKRTENGSVMLVVMLFLSGMLLVISSLWDATVYVAQRTHLNYEYHKNLNVAESLANYAVAIVVNNHAIVENFFMQPGVTLSLSTDPLMDALWKNNNQAKATIRVTKQGDAQYGIAASWQPNTKSLPYQVVCQLGIVKREEGVISGIIDQWAIL